MKISHAGIGRRHLADERAVERVDQPLADPGREIGGRRRQPEFQRRVEAEAPISAAVSV